MKFLRIALFLLVATFCWAEVPVIEFETTDILEFDFNHQYVNQVTTYWFEDNKIFISLNGRTAQIDLDTMDVHQFYSAIEEGYANDNFGQIFGRMGNKFLVERRRRNIGGYLVDIYIWDPRTSEYEILEGIDGGKLGVQIRRLFHYHDSIFIGSEDHDEWGTQYQYFYDTMTGDKKLHYYRLVDITSDKLVGIFQNMKKDIITVNIETKEVVGQLPRDSYPDDYYFISNNLVGTMKDNELHVLNLQGELQVIFRFNNKIFDTRLDHTFLKIRNSSYGYTGIDKYRCLLMQAPSEFDYLQENGYLFTPTTGRCNDTRVRVREWPLLDAQHLAFLEEGDELEILDRSGIKVQIGDMEDYWYKIRRLSDGLEGWSYGAFIELDEVE